MRGCVGVWVLFAMAGESDSDLSSLPPELPLSSGDEEGGEVPAVLEPSTAPAPVSAPAQIAVGPGGPSLAPPRRVDSVVRRGLGDVAPFGVSFLPTAKRGGRGRGRGRPKKAPRAPLPFAPGGDAGHLQVQRHVGAAPANVVPQSAERFSLAAWFEEQVTDDMLLRRARIPPGDVGLGQPRVVNGFAGRPADADALVAAVALGSGVAPGAVTNLEKVLSFFLQREAFSVSSTTAVSALLGAPRRMVSTSVLRAGAALSMLSQGRRFVLERSLVAKLRRPALLQYVEAVQYDETPLNMRIVGDAGPAQTAHAAQPAAASSLTPAANAMMLMNLRTGRPLQVRAAQAPQRIVQTRQDVGLVVSCDQGAATISFRCLTPPGGGGEEHSGCAQGSAIEDLASVQGRNRFSRAHPRSDDRRSVVQFGG